MSRKSTSPFVCQRCGLPVREFQRGVWKHSGGYRAISCGKPPDVVSREKYETDMREAADLTALKLRVKKEAK